MPKRTIVLLLVILGIIGYVVYQFFGGKHVVPVATQLLLHQEPQLQQTNGKTNILLLGIGGGTHDGPDLTDTIILASIDVKANKVSLISVPRDLWIPDLKGKINTAYSDGEDNDQHKGLSTAKSVVGEVLGQPIHYGVRIDFGGFEKAVDEVGGLDVNVAGTLDDYHYPIEGQEDATCGHSPADIDAFVATTSADQALWDFFPCRYKHLHFDPGVQQMDGTTALQFVRSRHGVGSEGSDFARSRRQHLVIEAFRTKLLSAGILLNPVKLVNLYNIVKGSIDTDIPESMSSSVITLLQNIKSAKIENAVIDFGDYLTGRAGLLDNSPVSAEYDYSAALIPRVGNGNFSEIHAYVTCEITKGNCVVPDAPGGIIAPPTPSVSPTPKTK